MFYRAAHYHLPSPDPTFLAPDSLRPHAPRWGLRRRYLRGAASVSRPELLHHPFFLDFLVRKPVDDVAAVPLGERHILGYRVPFLSRIGVHLNPVCDVAKLSVDGPAAPANRNAPSPGREASPTARRDSSSSPASHSTRFFVSSERYSEWRSSLGHGMHRLAVAHLPPSPSSIDGQGSAPRGCYELSS